MNILEPLAFSYEENVSILFGPADLRRICATRYIRDAAGDKGSFIILFFAFDLALVVATLLGLNGAVKIYHNWQMGKKEITADVAAWFYAAFFMILAGAFLKALFGI